jgi:hypothetical protein
MVGMSYKTKFSAIMFAFEIFILLFRELLRYGDKLNLLEETVMVSKPCNEYP